MQQNLPILYSLQNCPYAIRARFALFKAQQRVLIRAVKLNNKPPEMLIASPKGSVPVLVVENYNIIEESLDIMLWAFAQQDPQDLTHQYNADAKSQMIALIKHFEENFIPALEAYCCAKRYHEDNLDECREVCQKTLQSLEEKLTSHAFLYSEKESLLDIALFPFLRKFSRVERQWYRNSPYPKLRQWLAFYLQGPTFTKVMANHELWLENKKDIYFGK
ncbi:glutathione S-transferase [Psychromonas sp. KJ10-10]|uniref:glutathione S-transferase n=1 Tax=Psychromonas sp. KJ10-10 TaxID=3391823 RepID=UPI0039B4FB81